MHKAAKDIKEQEAQKESLGEAPGVLAKRNIVQPVPWCPSPPADNADIDPSCDPDNPRKISYNDISKANALIHEEISETPLLRSKSCKQFEMEVYYKLEIFHQTGSFNERKAFYALSMLSEEQRSRGVITASLGNWALALAYYGQRLKIPVTVVLPSNSSIIYVGRCHELGAFVVSYGENLDEARGQAFIMLKKRGQVYINGYDHPHVIAASGSIGVEILRQLPQADVIMAPVGGGGLLAGVAAAVKHMKPEILVYGIESNKSRSFFKAMENDGPQKTAVTRGLATSLAVPIAGYNAYHTAKPLVDKLVLVDDDWIARAILHLAEEEKLVVEGAAAASLGAFMAIPDVLPELRRKSVVCILTGGNIETITLSRCLERAKAIEGRIIKLSVRVHTNDPHEHLRVLSMIANVGGNIINYLAEKAMPEEDEYDINYLKILCETKGIEHACTLKRVMERLFPNQCKFLEEPFSPIPICACFPRSEDFDEFCDPDNPRTITYDDAVNAQGRIRKYMPETPYTISHKQRDFAMNIYYKLETVQKTGR
ncbi:L-threonine ammonia-lyase-like [Zerene cesonia]|uniref:L-threonine ammonia-lyase-like n=1 Tax=Zerene cesonia TaxID=33412 RepID=UPI0018E5668B|nr:L-threonine ammonia-lyase-like [Zerene cesonia]